MGPLKEIGEKQSELTCFTSPKVLEKRKQEYPLLMSNKVTQKAKATVDYQDKWHEHGKLLS